MSASRTLLGLLEPEPSYGYTLKQRYDELLAPRELRFGQVYATLGRFERDGLATVIGVESGAGPDRRRYAITPAGVTELEQWLNQPEPPDQFAGGVLFAKTTLALLSGRSATDILDAQRRVHLRRMRELTRARPAADTVGQLAITYELAHLDADLRWIEETVTRVPQLTDLGGTR